ncbi:MAG: TonB-dependent receptor, partial [Chitinophagaceae bacterium]|nr:TonB-dependent receptor [Chitinophagaceae bacterium]
QLRFSLDVFQQDRYDILPEISAFGDPVSNGTIPSYLGFNDLPLFNQGKVKNKGFELVLGFTTKDNKKLQFFADANIFYSKNEIVYNAEAPQFNNGLLRTGYVIGIPIGLKALGLFQTQDEVNNSPKPIGANVRVGDIKYQDVGGRDGKPDGIIDGNDNTRIGNPFVPNFTVGLHTGIQYKGFDLDITLQGVSGRTVYLGGNYFNQFQNSNGAASALALDRWTPETSATAEFPRLSLTGNQNNYRFSSFYQRDGSFIKLRSAELGYSLPASVISKVRLTSGRVFINGTNLFSIDKIEYGDPEAFGTGYPSLRTVSLGLRVGL